MSNPSENKSSKRVLEPIERISEVLFGLIMALTFTGSLSVAEAGRTEIRTMLIGALGCNLAWGIIDGIMYLMACLSEQAQRLRTLRAVRKAATPEEAHRVIAAALPPAVAPVLQPEELERMRLHVTQLPEPPPSPRLRSRDWRGAFGVFLLVFLSTLPVVLPFVFMHEAGRAIRVSNGIAIVLLFLTGYAFGRCAGLRPWVMGISMVVLGCLLVAITIALGG
jgi:VIT1/CCC1 family predicted Fe2+/Mn2+ transporter